MHPLVFTLLVILILSAFVLTALESYLILIILEDKRNDKK